MPPSVARLLKRMGRSPDRRKCVRPKYFNTVMDVGCACYLAAWILMRSDIDKSHRSVIGLMGIVSLTTLICWELFAMPMPMEGLKEINFLSAT